MVVLQDLHFLFATDDKLQEDLAYLCDLIAPTPPSDGPPSVKPRTTQYKRQRAEILELRRQRKNVTYPCGNEWLATKNLSRSTNTQLRSDIEQNASFIDQTVRTLSKKPRLELDVSSQEWKTYTLVVQASLRTDAIHAIADRQYSFLQTASSRKS
ncbi:hypothetical protein AeRB84_003779 [Aphanomyces euteiches]|nr:hypothetical protein AeRB84_003779 [Aphanomyces euteiches]